MTEQSLQPTTPAEADVKLAGLVGNPHWSAKLLAGDAAARADFDSLSAMAHGTTTDAAILSGSRR
jgi:hypothetical protein